MIRVITEVMVVDRKLTVRLAGPADRNAILNLTRFDEDVHVHLDWKPVDEWLGHQPFLVAERGRQMVASLACPPDPPDTAWLRLFTQASDASTQELWSLLWGRAEIMLRERGVRRMAALAMEDWVERLCLEAGFRYTEAMVVLGRARAKVQAVPLPAGLTVRPARVQDHAEVIAIDTAAFGPPWQMSGELLALAINRADYLTVAEREGALVGFQLATPGHQGAHLARLAVRPEQQGQGIGAALVAEMLDHYHRRGAREVTVNTQDTNAASLTLYQRLGFVPNGLRFPVYQLELAVAP